MLNQITYFCDRRLMCLDIIRIEAVKTHSEREVARDPLRSEKLRQEGGVLMGIGGIRLPKLRTHPLLLRAKLGPKHKAAPAFFGYWFG